ADQAGHVHRPQDRPDHPALLPGDRDGAGHRPARPDGARALRDGASSHRVIFSGFPWPDLVAAAVPPWSRRGRMRLDDLVDADVIVVGAGLAGLAATAELASAGRRVLLLD